MLMFNILNYFNLLFYQKKKKLKSEINFQISYIAAILNEPYFKDQLCNEFKIMSTVLLVGMDSGAVYAIDLRQNHIEMRKFINIIYFLQISVY